MTKRLEIIGQEPYRLFDTDDDVIAIDVENIHKLWDLKWKN